jgi:hypothetical protein
MKVARAAAEGGYHVAGGCPSPITGAEGNREFFLHLKPGAAVAAPAGLDVLVGGILDG